MSDVPAADVQAAADTKVTFGALLAARYKCARESQRDAAEWLTDWMAHHDIETELREIERTCLDEDLDDTKDAIAIIRNHLVTSGVGEVRSITQGALSKWRKEPGEGGGRPSPSKWVALSRYMGIPLGEMYRLVTYMEMPKSMIALQSALRAARKDVSQLEDDLRQTHEELDRAERIGRQQAEELTAMRLRMDALERAVRESGSALV